MYSSFTRFFFYFCWAAFLLGLFGSGFSLDFDFGCELARGFEFDFTFFMSFLGLWARWMILTSSWV
jgi:hypothetical protein